MPSLALFDFDGTITFADTFTPFVYYAVEPRRLALGKIALSPFVLGYRLRMTSASRLRSKIVAFGFRGRDQAEIARLGTRYARERLPQLIRPQARSRIHWHQARGDTVVVVSASLSVYLSEWCEEAGLDLIATELEADHGFLTGRYRGGDCTGPEKADRVRAKYALDTFTSIYAYGDTEEDEPLLALAHKKYFRWQERASS